MTLPEILTIYLRSQPDYVHGGDLEELARHTEQRDGKMYEGETAKRRLREMTQYGHRLYDSNIEEKTVNGAICYRYRYSGFNLPMSAFEEPKPEPAVYPPRPIAKVEGFVHIGKSLGI